MGVRCSSSSHGVFRCDLCEKPLFNFTILLVATYLNDEIILHLATLCKYGFILLTTLIVFVPCAIPLPADTLFSADKVPVDVSAVAGLIAETKGLTKKNSSPLS